VGDLLLGILGDGGGLDVVHTALIGAAHDVNM
jgi:hypothetical protein